MATVYDITLLLYSMPSLTSTGSGSEQLGQQTVKTATDRCHTVERSSTRLTGRPLKPSAGRKNLKVSLVKTDFMKGRQYPGSFRLSDHCTEL